MSVYVDPAKFPFRGYIMCHMIADSLDELHQMADLIGMERRWFQTPPKASHPHYDIPEDKRSHAISLGAVEVCSRTALHYAARLGLEWSDATGDRSRTRKFERTLIRTQRYTIQPEPSACPNL
ncbi:hypothetical protein GCM10011309_26440 [Litorimonas cladophorae]|uniref:DUF4031 domain-containing protein n=1 Tax=Litorimonas cladophorae TaxID=1220491 RepID=A0A918KT89_9PROT|nr:DUF4031 domain-containing protein [Litorimonas cladophorae]GGX74959.1 hypothetical protein GCM10011309_26440 [Litorimonas cladophorae]